MLGPTSDEMAAQLGISDLRYSSIIKMGGATFVACLETAALLIHNNSPAMSWCSAPATAAPARASPAASIPSRDRDFRRDFESPYGFSVPGQWYAMIARRHMIEFGTTRADAGHFAVAMRKHANLNPNAMMRDVKMSMDDYMSSKPVYDPFHLLDCCLESDGAGAFVVSAAGPRQGHAAQAGLHQRCRAGEAGLLRRSRAIVPTCSRSA